MGRIQGKPFHTWEGSKGESKGRIQEKQTKPIIFYTELGLLSEPFIFYTPPQIDVVRLKTSICELDHDDAV
ncbi:hypothetical protein, partial [Streptomyces plicatus]|uniref:hypothetical protein n=1 Tax=Streptomyces plicatus TaxID=1922 RepID=UPI001C705B11